MSYSELSSKSNDKIKYVNKLVSSSPFRRQEGLFVIEGARLCADAYRSGYEISECFITRTAMSKYADTLSDLLADAGEVYLITDGISSKLSDTVNSQGVFCVVKMKERMTAEVKADLKYIALENVQNPQNLGTVARTAEALGINGLILSDGCDIYNPKALRASMGSLLRIPVIKTDDLCTVLKSAAEKGMLTLATVPDSSAEDITALDFSGGVITVIGNEGNGVTEQIKNAVKHKATIRMKGETESLNAASAAVIAMWEMMR